jgi:hypothetical protein
MKFLFSGAAVKEQKCFGDALLQGDHYYRTLLLLLVLFVAVAAACDHKDLQL